jgi:drug/metabolite transporter (DMT)-like permease
METEVESKKKIVMTKGEIAWTVIASLIAFGGLFLVVLGFVGDYIPVKSSENWILTGETAFKSVMKMPYRWFGVILVIAAALIEVISLNYYARKGDIDEERALRRQQRLQVISASAEADKAAAANNAVEVNSTPKPAETK